jgi:hypothetical protein
MGFHQAQGNGQTDARTSTRLPRAGFIHPVETIKDMRQVFRRDTDSGIRYGNMYFAIMNSGRDGHPATPGSILQGIPCQVEYHLAKTILIC